MKRNEILRLCVLCVLWTLAAAFLLCEGEDVAGVLAVKAVGILVDMIERRSGNRHVRAETTLRPGGSVRAIP